MTVLAPLAPTDLDAQFAQIVDDLTRRGFLAGGLSAAAVLGLAACGSDDSGRSAPASPTTRTVSSAYGDVEVPADPKRVIALSKAAVNTLLDVGMTAIGTDEGEADVALARYQKAVAAMTPVGTYGEFSVEKIAALKPDLIISYDTYLDAKLYPQVAAVAPTVAIATDDGNIAWQTASRKFAEAVNRSAQLTALGQKLQQKIAETAQTYGDILKANRWEVVQNDSADGAFFRYLPTSDPSGILTQLGATLGDADEKGPNYWGKPHSYETIDDLLGKADAILYVKVGSSELLGQAPWKRLPAVSAGHAFGTDLLFPACYNGALELVDFVANACQTLQESK